MQQKLPGIDRINALEKTVKPGCPAAVGLDITRQGRQRQLTFGSHFEVGDGQILNLCWVKKPGNDSGG